MAEQQQQQQQQQQHIIGYDFKSKEKFPSA